MFSMPQVRNGKVALQSLVIILVLLTLSLYVGAAPALLSPARAVLPVAAVLGVTGLLIFGAKPVWGLYGILLLANTIPFDIETGSNTGLSVALLMSAVLIGAWLVWMLVQGHVTLQPSALNRPALLLAALFGLGLLVGRIPWMSGVGRLTSLQVQIAQVALVWISVGIMLLAGNRLTVKELRRFTYAYLALCGVIIANAIGASLFSLPYLFKGTVGMFPSLVAVLGLGLARYDTDLPWIWRVGLVTLVAAWFLWGAVLAVELASAWVPILCGIGVMLFFYSKKGFAVAALGGLAFVALFPQQLLAPFNAVLDGGTVYRTDIWLKVVDATRVNPILGLGPAGYRSYIYTFIDFNPEIFRNLPEYVWDGPSHNQYVDQYAQTGLVGLGVYVWLLVAAFLSARQIYLNASDGFSKGYGLAMLGGVAAVGAIGIIGDWILPYVYNIGLKGYRQSVFTWIFLGGMIVLNAAFNARDAETQWKAGEDEDAA